MKKVHLITAAALAFLATACGNSKTAADNDSVTLQTDTAAVAATSANQDSVAQPENTTAVVQEAEQKGPELNISSFYKKESSDQYSIQSLKNVEKCLTDAGFTLKEKGTEKVTRGPYDDEVVKYPEWTYQNGAVEVEVVTYPNGSDVYYIDFEFADKASADEFIKNAKADGFKKQSDGLYKGNMVPLILNQKGKDVQLSALRDED